jgi:hypothetical protein
VFIPDVPSSSIPAIEADRTKIIELDGVILSLGTAFPAPSTAETTLVSGVCTDVGI